jgi:3-hydroxyacyl-CoA dehydrogenase/enoyl-CoA hydratase/3-hydroxybutyryl-CoA epimerase
VQLGLVPGWGGTVHLPRKVGLTRALKMITAGQQLNGRQAYSAGLVDAVVPPEGLRSAAMQTLQRRPKPRRRDFVQRWLVESAPGRSLIFRFAKKQIQEKTKGKYPAPEKALEVLRAGMQSQAAGFESEAVNSPSTRSRAKASACSICATTPSAGPKRRPPAPKKSKSARRAC